MTQEVQQYQPQRRTSLVATTAERFGVEPDKLLSTLKATAFRAPRNSPEVTNEQMMALLIVSNEYGLNPFLKEIYAFPDKQNGIVPVIGVDGWNRLANEHPAFDGIEVRQSENWITPEYGKRCPEWIEVTVHRNDRKHPMVAREYLEEVYRAPFMRDGKPSLGPWQQYTKRMLGHRARIQGYRTAFGFAGLRTEQEAQEIIESTAVEVQQQDPGAALASSLRPALEQQASTAIDEVVDTETGEVLERTEAAPAAPAKDEAAHVVKENQREDPPADLLGDEPALSINEVMDALADAQDRDALDAALDLGNGAQFTAAMKKRIRAAYDKRAEQLGL